MSDVTLVADIGLLLSLGIYALLVIVWAYLSGRDEG